MNRLDKFEEILNSYEGREFASDTSFDIEEFPDFYRVPGIQHRGKVVSYDFAKDALPIDTQEGHAERAAKAQDTEFRASDAPVIYALCKTLHQNKDGKQKDLVENARKSLEGIIGPGQPWINTLSRAICDETGFGEIIHDYKQKTQYSKQAKLVGPDGYITKPDTQAEEYVHVALDTTDSMQEINEVFQWVTGKETYAHSLISSPETKHEWVFALGVDDGVWFDLGASGNIYGNWPALGVRCAGEKVKP